MKPKQLLDRVNLEINSLQLQAISSSDVDESLMLRIMLDGLQSWFCGNKLANPVERINMACDNLWEDRPRIVKFRNELPSTPGCYFFLSEIDVLYVGTASNIRSRVGMRFDDAVTVAYMELDDDIRFNVEANLIILLKPTRNSIVNISRFGQ